MNRNQREEEIKTIKERKITVKLSDADCERLLRKCGECGLSINELITSFIGDLVYGTFVNGTDESDFAEMWFERCGFGMYSENTLFKHLFCKGVHPLDYLDILDDIETAQEDKKYIDEHPAEANDEVQYIDDDIADWEKELKDMREDWKPDIDVDIDKEIEVMRKYVDEYRHFFNNI